METINVRLKALRKEAGLSVRKLAAALGVPPSTYAAYEDPAKFKKPVISLTFAKQLVEILEPRGLSKDDVLALAGVTGELSILEANKEPDVDDEWLEAQGSVAAGVWREQSEWPASERYLVRFGPSKYSKDQRFCVRMDGRSMNLTILPGADLECLWVKFSPIPPKPGDLVIVERHAHDLVELTCKRLAMDGDEYILLAESTDPEFQEPIRLGKPSEDNFSDNEVRVVGIVLSAKLNLAPPNLDERRFRQG